MASRPEEPSLTLQTMRLAGVWEDIVRLKPRFRLLLPEDLAGLKERLGELHPEGGAKRAADYDLFYRIGVILAGLSGQREALTMGALSEALAVPLSTATRMVDWLVESGYAQRLGDPEDRRIVRVALTETGRALYETINSFLRQRVERILRRFTPEEREMLILLLRKLVRSLEAEVAR